LTNGIVYLNLKIYIVINQFIQFTQAKKLPPIKLVVVIDTTTAKNVKMRNPKRAKLTATWTLVDGKLFTSRQSIKPEETERLILVDFPSFYVGVYKKTKLLNF